MEGFFSSPESQDQVRVICLFLALVLLVIGVYRRRLSRIKIGTASIEASETKRLGDLTEPSDLLKQIYSRTRELVFFENIRFWVSIFVGSIVLIYASAFAFIRPISRNAEEWGQLGDFFGGVLNPALAFASFIALLYTIRLQSEELRLTKDELKKATKAQQEMAVAAKESGERVLYLEQYRHSSDLVRKGNDTLEDLLRRPFKHNYRLIFEAIDISNLAGLYGALSWGVMHLDTWDERISLAKENLKSIVHTHDNMSKLSFELNQFIVEARRQKSYVSAYAEYCSRLGYPMHIDTIEFIDVRDSTEFMVKAVFFAFIFEGFTVKGLFPKEDNAAFGIFLDGWRNQGFPAEALIIPAR